MGYAKHPFAFSHTCVTEKNCVILSRIHNIHTVSYEWCTYRFSIYRRWRWWWVKHKILGAQTKTQMRVFFSNIKSNTLVCIDKIAWAQHSMWLSNQFIYCSVNQRENLLFLRSAGVQATGDALMMQTNKMNSMILDFQE